MYRDRNAMDWVLEVQYQATSKRRPYDSVEALAESAMVWGMYYGTCLKYSDCITAAKSVLEVS